MTKIKGVLFDMDGVIFDTEKAYLETWTKVFKSYGYDLKRETYISIMGTGRDNAVSTFKEAFGNDIPMEDMYKDKDRILKEIIESGSVPLKPGAVEILTYLRENNIKTALATSARMWRAETQLKMSGIKDMFDKITCGDEIKNLKPDPDIFLKSAQKLALNPDECIVIEDSPAGIQAAFNAGMYGIHVEDLKEADATIKKYCQANFKNLMEIKEYLADKFLK
ncbi:HAD family phosphatase [uncultured Clostridium sp.]|uniref:HAD family hydrolase n=1 Tax=uncultured Clostridium sp. TaxID=59620 RepID=UPI0025D3B4DA|nr:HAD family phosphatase [uncultured Clostridium sp.]